jgi:hypothetical protein
MIKWEKIDFWVVPMISIGMCLLSEVIDKIILAILFCIFASIKVQQNQFGNQRVFRINRRLLPRKQKKLKKLKFESAERQSSDSSRITPTHNDNHLLTVDSHSPTLQNPHPRDKKSILTLPLKLHDDSKDDVDSIHSFDLNESVSRIVTNVIDGFHDFTQDDLSLNCDDEFDDLDTQIKSLLTQWGDAEYDLFKKDMNKMKIHENGRYLSDNEIEKWKSTNELRQQLPNG